MIALLEHAGGAKLAQIIAETGWQKHTVRDFFSTLASKQGFVVTSMRARRTRRESTRSRKWWQRLDSASSLN
jgi:hypothetical protein